MILSWFDASKSKEFGGSLATFFMQRLPLDNAGKKQKSMDKKQEVLDKMFTQVARFKSENKLNVYKKAQLGNTFRWTLVEAGYDSAFVDQLTKELMKRF